MSEIATHFAKPPQRIITGRELTRDPETGYLQSNNRPDGLTGVKKRAIIEMVAAGEPLEASCERLDINPSTFYFHLGLDERLRSDLEVVRKAHAYKVENVLAQRAIDPKATLDRIVYLKAHLPEKYNPQISGEKSVNIQVNVGNLESAKSRENVLDAQIVTKTVDNQ